jgi:hypothetical protein
MKRGALFDFLPKRFDRFHDDEWRGDADCFQVSRASKVKIESRFLNGLFRGRREVDQRSAHTQAESLRWSLDISQGVILQVPFDLPKGDSIIARQLTARAIIAIAQVPEERLNLSRFLRQSVPSSRVRHKTGLFSNLPPGDDPWP